MQGGGAKKIHSVSLRVLAHDLCLFLFLLHAPPPSLSVPLSLCVSPAHPSLLLLLLLNKQVQSWAGGEYMHVKPEKKQGNLPWREERGGKEEREG